MNIDDLLKLIGKQTIEIETLRTLLTNANAELASLKEKTKETTDGNDNEDQAD